MTKQLIVAKGWKFIRPDKSFFMLWQYESYRITVDTHKGLVGQLMRITDQDIPDAVISIGGFDVRVYPENLEEL